jgi:hypothetical protein
MTHSALDRNGDSVWSPSPKQRRALLASLTADEAEACVSLTHDGQWAITAYHSGLVCFENAGAGEGPWHMTGIPVTEILDLWQLLTEGNIQELRKQPWQDGNGVQVAAHEKKA